MVSIFVKDPSDIPDKHGVDKYDFTFLDKTYPEYKIYYQLLKNMKEYKIKNVYHFIYVRLIQMHQKFGDITLLPKEIKIDFHTFNTLLNDYISEDKMKAIYIINCICHYFYPSKH